MSIRKGYLLLADSDLRRCPPLRQRTWSALASYAIMAGAGSCRWLAITGRTRMFSQSLLGAIALSAILSASTADAQILDYGKYPDLKGQWVRWGPSGADLKGPLVRDGPEGQFRTRFDPHKPPGRGPEVPFAPE